MGRTLKVAASVLIAGLAVSITAAQQPPPGPLPPPPVPPQNPINEPKRLLGKILFWDEQVSSRSTVACGACHQPGAGGGDGRIAIHPGPDLIQPSPDDIVGSLGVARFDSIGVPVADPIFGFSTQVTKRSANTPIGAAYAPALFWDGRATPNFVDPETGQTIIPVGGGLESQAVGPILNDGEMAYAGRTWSDVRHKLEHALPLADSTNLPADLTTALASNPSYPQLFQQAFGDPTISAQRIALAIATYERTLTANQTPWDAFVSGNPGALTAGQVAGWNFFNNSPCRTCHTPPTFTNQTFRNIGMRPPAEDLGRQIVTGLNQDRGRFKVPTLRNVGLKPTHMHNGRLPTLQDAVLWYRPNNPDRFTDNLDPILPVAVPPNVLPALLDFLNNGLTDPRVAQQAFPFDRPTLHAGNLPRLDFEADHSTMHWPPLSGVTSYRMYRGDLASLHLDGPDGLPLGGYGTCVSGGDPNQTDTVFVDPDLPAPGFGFFYLKAVVDPKGAERGLGATSAGLAHTVTTHCT
jgi:cytochrome c peroxidase